MSIFRGNSRTEEKNGIRFYEQDILMLDFIATGDIIIDFDVDYRMPGIGVVLEKLNASDTRDSLYLIKTGTYDFSVYRHMTGEQELLYASSSTHAPSGKTTYRLYKTGRILRLVSLQGEEEDDAGSYILQETISRYRMGIYSNAGNTISKLVLYEGCPDGWITNIRNTNGGRVSFFNSTVAVEDAKNDIEVQAQRIPVPAGRHYFSYSANAMDGKLEYDIYLYPSDMEELEISPDKKNLLQKDEGKYGDIWYFDLLKDTDLTLLIQANSAEIHNLSIKDDYRQGYVATDKDAKEQDGSYILVKTENITAVEWEGSIQSIPEVTLDKDAKYSVYTYAGIEHTLESLYLSKNKTYRFSIRLDHDASLCRQSVYDGDDLVVEAETAMDGSDIIIFQNLNGEISSMYLTDRQENQWDVMQQRTLTKYIPTGLSGPIIVVGSDKEPLDLSSSYRHILDTDRYVFTNWAREVFPSSGTAVLDHDVNGTTNIIVYGIKGSYKEKSIYDIMTADAVNSIDCAADLYSRISGDLYTVSGRTLEFDKTVYRNYDSFIIDYLKDDSYTINLDRENSQYRVDISTSQETVHAYYDMGDSGTSSEYAALPDIEPEDDKYVVLTRSVEV